MLLRLVLGLLALAAAVLGVRALAWALASDATVIRWRMEAAVEGFDDERSGPTLRLLAPDFLDESSGADRDLVRAGMAHLFFQERDPRTKRFTLDLELPEEALSVEVSGSSAVARGRLRLSERVEEESRSRWELSFEAELVKDDEEGWRVRRSRHETLAGERPR